MVGHCFKFERCSYTVGKGAKQKDLVRDITGYVEGGHVLAMMGPSGAGKTIMINMLTLTPGPGDPTGSITLNDESFSRALYTRQCALVAQTDHHCAFLTAREHIELSVAFYQFKSSAEDQRKEVTHLISTMGLLSAENTRAGNALVRGLSGGQRRRLSLAVAMSKHPKVVFLDEPTSGLDAASAASIMLFLKEAAFKLDIAIVCTIHQPSSKVWQGFDDTLILSMGRMVYFGSAAKLPEYLDTINFSIPGNSNPAEYILDLVNADFSSREKVTSVIGEWARAVPPQPKHVEYKTSRSETKTAPWLAQVWIMVGKLGKLLYKDPTVYVARMAVFLVFLIFFAIIYIRSRELSQDQFQNRMWLQQWFFCVPTQLAVVAVYSGSAEIQMVKRDVKDGMYSASAYVIAHTFWQVPMVLLLSLAANGVPGYALAGFNGKACVPTVTIVALLLLSFECMAQLQSLSANVIVGMMNFINFWFSSFLFSGNFSTIENIVWPFRVFAYITPIYWTAPSLFYYLFKDDSSIPGAETCTNVSQWCNDRGFWCPEDRTRGLRCFGRSGLEGLDSLSTIFDMIESSPNVARDLSIVLAISVAIKLIFTTMLVKQCANIALPKLPVTVFRA